MGGGGGGWQFYMPESITLTCCFPVPHFQAFFANRACTREIEMTSGMRTLERGATSISPQRMRLQSPTALFSSLQVLQATKELVVYLSMQVL